MNNENNMNENRMNKLEQKAQQYTDIVQHTMTLLYPDTPEALDYYCQVHLITEDVEPWDGDAVAHTEHTWNTEHELDCFRVNVFVDAKVTYDEMVETLVHECVHVQQILKGRLQFLPEGMEWEGEFFPFCSTEDAYWDLPYEQEAYIIAEALYPFILSQHPSI